MNTLISRRRLMQAAGLGAVGVWVWGAPRLRGLYQNEPQFTQIEAVPPFRRYTNSGDFTAASIALIGIDQPTVNPADAATRADICGALFRGAPTPAIALFSDFNCPYCPAMDANVTQIARDTRTQVIRHQLPLLGRASQIASRAALAADMQGQYAAMYEALMRTPAVKNLTLIRRFADAAGLDADRLIADMQGDEVTRRLQQSSALGDILGLIGTPATVIGRTVILGTLPERKIARIIALEQELGEVCS